MGRSERRRDRQEARMIKRKQELRRDIACKKIVDQMAGTESYTCTTCGNVITLFFMNDKTGGYHFSKKEDELCDICKGYLNKLTELNYEWNESNKGTAD